MHNEEEQIVIHYLYFAASRFAWIITKLTDKTFDFGDFAPLVPLEGKL